VPVGYDISDPNSRIRNGNPLHIVAADGRGHPSPRLHAPSLCMALLRMSEPTVGGPITKGLDGTIGTENRIGEKVTTTCPERSDRRSLEQHQPGAGYAGPRRRAAPVPKNA
jgi:hypothetical protein